MYKLHFRDYSYLKRNLYLTYLTYLQHFVRVLQTLQSCSWDALHRQRRRVPQAQAVCAISDILVAIAHDRPPGYHLDVWAGRLQVYAVIFLCHPQCKPTMTWRKNAVISFVTFINCNT